MTSGCGRADNGDRVARAAGAARRSRQLASVEEPSVGVSQRVQEAFELGGVRLRAEFGEVAREEGRDVAVGPPPPAAVVEGE